MELFVASFSLSLKEPYNCSPNSQYIYRGCGACIRFINTESTRICVGIFDHEEKVTKI